MLKICCMYHVEEKAWLPNEPAVISRTKTTETIPVIMPSMTSAPKRIQNPAYSKADAPEVEWAPWRKPWTKAGLQAAQTAELPKMARSSVGNGFPQVLQNLGTSPVAGGACGPWLAYGFQVSIPARQTRVSLFTIPSRTSRESSSSTTGPSCFPFCV